MAATFGFAATDEKKAPNLRIVEASVLDSQDGYPIPDGSIFYPGEKLHYVFKVDGYQRSSDDLMRIKYRIDYVGPDGAAFAMSEMGELREELAPQDDKWKPIVRGKPDIPAHAGAGVYRVNISVFDFLSDTEVTRQLEVAVEGHNIETGGGLMVRNFEFRRAEDGERVKTADYRQGETVFGAFFITGFALTEENEFDVDSRLDIVADDGKIMYSFRPESEAGQNFYPRKWLPARFRIDLETVPSGDYGILVSILDKVSGAEYTTRERFRVR